MDADFRPDVVGGHWNPKLFDASGFHLLVKEIFYSVQGEGFHTGRGAVFIRLATCNLKCKFCDTDFENGEKIHLSEVIDRIQDVMAGCAGAPQVILTGGEPMLQNCERLIKRLRSDLGIKNTSIETSGSVWSPWATQLGWITVSPKVPKARIHHELLSYADEFKWIVNGAFKTLYERDPASVYHQHQFKASHNYLQPESNKQEWMTYATELVKKYPERYKLSLQTHKFAGNP